MARVSHFSRSRLGALLALTLAGLGLSHAVSAANGSVAYTYDALGRVASAFYDTGVCLLYTYDANGNRTAEKIIVVSGTPTTGVWGCFNWNGAKWGP
jgi:hypothetical protein